MINTFIRRSHEVFDSTYSNINFDIITYQICLLSKYYKRNINFHIHGNTKNT